MQYDVLNRWTGKVQFTATIECDADAIPGFKMGLAVKWGRRNGAALPGAVLRGAVLRGADLSGADLSGAHLSGAPKIESIHQAIYAAASAPAALDMSQWHNACGTAHCRAGWAVVLAGEAGKALEAKIGTPAAATLIYLASDPELDCFPSFYCGNQEALADMYARAEAEAAKAVQS